MYEMSMKHVCIHNKRDNERKANIKIYCLRLSSNSVGLSTEQFSFTNKEWAAVCPRMEINERNSIQFYIRIFFSQQTEELAWFLLLLPDGFFLLMDFHSLSLCFFSLFFSLLKSTECSVIIVAHHIECIIIAGCCLAAKSMAKWRSKPMDVNICRNQKNVWQNSRLEDKCRCKVFGRRSFRFWRSHSQWAYYLWTS